ncbi:MAG: cytochrome b, partial [Sneathiella sp.]|nr:cytochrome b [Sneathiella sp.]
PEWYFLPFYVILRAVPDKLGGVMLMFGAIAVLFALPWLDKSRVRSAKFRPIYKQLFWIFVLDCVVLTYIGGKPAEEPYILVGRIATVYYFVHILILLPLVGLFEKPKPLPASISESVLDKKPSDKEAGNA